MLHVITIKLPKNKLHDPHNKITGVCPVDYATPCTDVTGEHHTLVYSSPWETASQVRDFFTEQGWHVTRVESFPEHD